VRLTVRAAEYLEDLPAVSAFILEKWHQFTSKNDLSSCVLYLFDPDDGETLHFTQIPGSLEFELRMASSPPNIPAGGCLICGEPLEGPPQCKSSREYV
jgi:hypothetical protein